MGPLRSVERYNERERSKIRAQWYGWHCDQADRHKRTLEALIEHHEGEAEKLLEDPGEMDWGEGSVVNG